MLHPFDPVWNCESCILILGSFPSAASRDRGFYYGHPRNRFWRVLSCVYGEQVPEDSGGKAAFLLSHGLALWDALASCEASGSLDSDIRQAVPNDLRPLLEGAPIRRIIANGQLAGKSVRKMDIARDGLEVMILPSTSPANAAWPLERLCAAWKSALLE